MKRTGPAVPRAAAELPILVTLVMFGLVLLANPGRFGVPGAVLGGLLTGVGILACRRRFGRPEDSESTKED